MSWFGKFSLPKLINYDKYYFIPEVYENNLFSIYNTTSVMVNEKEISKPMRGVNIIAISKEVISSINPAADFTVSVEIIFKGKKYQFSRVGLDSILTNETLKYPEYLTTAILTAGEESIDFGDEIYIKSGGLTVPKFIDVKVTEKLTKAINEAVWNVWRSSQFTLTNEGSDFLVSVEITLHHTILTKIGENSIGPIRLPELKEVAKVNNSQPMLVKSIIIDNATVNEI
jgi:hypothetical protein